MTFLSHARRVHVLSTATILLVLSWAACLRDPDVTKMKCTRDCPTGFICVNPDPSGPNGHCHPVADSGPVVDAPVLAEEDGAAQSGIDALSHDGDRLDGVGLDSARIEAGTVGSLDTPPIDGALDQAQEAGTALDGDAPETGGQGGIAGSGGASGTGGISGTGGVAGRDGGGGLVDLGADLAASGGTSGSGGDTRPADASISSGGAPGTGGAETGGAPGTGGSGTGGNGTGGSGTGGNGTGGLSGTGGTTGTGGVTGKSDGAAGSIGGVTVQLDQTHQTIEGFGLSTALGGGSVPWDTFYSTSGSGLGFSIVRVGMTSSGGLSGSVPPASYNARVIGSAWTAPANCKNNGSTQQGGHLYTSCYDSWSTTIANFAKNQGLYAMSAANEPDFASCGQSIGPPCNGDYDSMVFTAKEMVAWVKVLGPKLKIANVKLIAPEPQEWIHLWSNTSATGSLVSSHPNSSDPLQCGCFGNTPTTTGCAIPCTSGGGYDYGHWLAADATAWAAIDIIGTHEYDTQKAEPWPADVNGGKPSKEVWTTEMSGVMYWPEQGPTSDINNGIAVAGWVHSALVDGEASAWLYWWYQAGGTNDNEGLVLKTSTALTKRCYTIGNYSKFVRPGYVRVDVTGNSNTDLLLSAFTGTDGTVIVAVNKGTAAADVPITISGGTAPASCTPNVTSLSANLTAGTAIAVTGGSFTASLAATSVTTFVCN